MGGRVLITRGVESLGDALIGKAFAAVRTFSTFTADNDPYGEHDFGIVELEGRKLFWKIDYYDHTLQCGSPDPSDPTITTRVLTIMLAEEY